MKRIISVILLLCLALTMFSLTGCAKLKDEKYIIERVEKLYPNSKHLKNEYHEGEDGLDDRTYYFTNGDFEFSFCNYLGKDYSGFKYNSVSSDYYEKLYEYKKDEIVSILDNTDIPIIHRVHNVSENKDNYEEIEEFEKANNFRCIIDTMITNDYTDKITFEFYVENISQIEPCITLVTDLYNCVKKYIPNESTDYCESISIYFRTSHKYQTPENEYKSEDDSIYTEICGLSKNKFNIKNIKRWAEYKYAVLVKDNKISDTKIDVDKVKHLYLNNLVINDKQVKSEKYNIEFIYNIEDGKYYTIVCFGTELSYNGGVKDYLQREIIEEYYSDTNYEIVNFKNKTTYKIGKNEYEVKWVTERKTFAEDLEYMKFYKNGKDMNIKNYETIGNDSSGASYYRLISLDDFAKIMEMDIENIDQSTKTIYLVTK